MIAGSRKADVGRTRTRGGGSCVVIAGLSEYICETRVQPCFHCRCRRTQGVARRAEAKACRGYEWTQRVLQVRAEAIHDRQCERRKSTADARWDRSMTLDAGESSGSS